jgi:hypothetical protein
MLSRERSLARVAWWRGSPAARRRAAPSTVGDAATTGPARLALSNDLYVLLLGCLLGVLPSQHGVQGSDRHRQLLFVRLARG